MVTQEILEQGVIGPVTLINSDECKSLVQSIIDAPGAMDWPKALAAHNPDVYALARHPALLEILREKLGEDIILWGASMVTRGAGQVHPWHNDIESSTQAGKSLSVWIGLENTSIETGLSFVTHSHEFGKTVQEIQAARDFDRETSTNEEVLRWAREINDRATIVTPDISDGQAVLFDGRIWHSSNNKSELTRRALLLQYCNADMPVYMPDMNYLKWPVRTLKFPRPACIPISGECDISKNRIVSGPVSQGGMKIELTEGRIHPLHVPLAIEENLPWQPFDQFKGTTSQLHTLTCHISALRQGETPHPPHQHKEEEILMVLDGEAEVHLPDLGDDESKSKVRLKRGDVVYYPAWFYHTLTTVSSRPANYLMFKWYNNPINDLTAEMPYWRVSTLDDFNGDDGQFVATHHKDGQTDCLYKLHMHTSVLQPGAGYEPHADAYDVAIVTLEGTVETLDTVVEANSVVFYPAGSSHGMRNVGDTPARYVVFEFHGAPSRIVHKGRPLFTKLTDPHAWKRKIKSILGR